MLAHGWPGNVRELENVVQRALILEPDEVIEAEDLRLAAPPPSASAGAPVAAGAPPGTVQTASAPGIGSEHVAENLVVAGAPTDMKTLERLHIQETLANVGGSRKKAVAILGISERTLRYKLNQYRGEGFFNESEND